MSRGFKITLLILGLAVLAGLVYLPGLRRQVLRLARLEKSEEQARREVIESLPELPLEKKEKVQIYWLSADDPGRLAGVEVALPLGQEPAARARMTLETLIANVPAPEQRTLPADASLLEFYVLPEGTVVADFSDALSREVPAGISSEQLAVDSIARTVHSAVPAAQRLRILIQGQEVETLAGHVDLSGTFDLATEPPGAQPAGTPQTPPGGSSAPAEKKAPAKAALTQPKATGKLERGSPAAKK
jgi:hypothetical protein